MDSLKGIIYSAKEDTTKAEAYRNWALGTKELVPKRSLDISTKGIAFIDSVFLHSQPAEKEKERLIDCEASLYRNRGLIYSGEAKWSIAMENMLKSKDLQQKNNHPHGVSLTENGIGNIYYRQGLPEEALLHYERSLEICDSLDNQNGIAGAYINIANAYDDMEQDSVALEYHLKSQTIFFELEDYNALASSYTNVAGIYYFMGQKDSARIIQQRSVDILRKLQNQESLAIALVNMGELEFEIGNTSEAKKMALESLGLANQLGKSYIRLGLYELLHRIYKEEGNYQMALEMIELHHQVKDSVKNVQQQEEVLRLELEGDFEKERVADSVAFAKQKLLDDSENQAKLDKAANFRYLMLIGLVALSGLGFVLFRSNRRKKKDNEIIGLQKQEVEDKNKEITDSITYAKRIQEAILPNRNFVTEVLPQSMIYYAPKDIVAGDFYWVVQHGDHLIFAVADCTGHGVPGAMVSVVCHNALNRSVREFGLTDPAEILERTSLLVQETFATSQNEIKDGMDIALCSLNTTSNQLQFAGANNGLYRFRNGELYEIKPTKRPIGSYAVEKDFESHQIDLQIGDTIYLFTDGFADQFGGDSGKKLKYKTFKTILSEASELPISEQHDHLQDAFVQWKGEFEQIDDVCVMGIKF